MKPLLVGFDESTLSPSARHKLARAKTDFLYARSGKLPQLARETAKQPNSNSRVFRGDGYEITLVDDSVGFVHRTGPAIVLESGITGGEAFRYEEVERWDD